MPLLQWPHGRDLERHIEHVTFHNAVTGFAVLRVQPRQRELVTVVGQLPTAVAGEYVGSERLLEQDRDHGLQFKPTSCARCRRTRSPESKSTWRPAS